MRKTLSFADSIIHHHQAKIMRSK